ncbi:B3/B4 domain-containing protein [Anaerotignum propionicum]|uniref:B3/B4 domain-containing protein (DNA/RNA-binding domain of Phe-tRNA-synthetase) n=1 Tax=Anaerotignum propionicum DSM 1682 TaxID=991789 RepID=A0A0X8VA42_ANAPI|nr:phenylalanine--tRNA ligase beta subunit-related protein [Anaerotignum propionicum]AMJ40249.1 phenylalanine--tRNA ligase beta subunit [Anaerotignum propionicum DSM 1682]SHE46650.1 B3/B4 domain-containing protein (DNA/RNA-binding domain of Phe-tRNA-synthetase) [[Clostridium] propionicum DSM 1682] [Anaerotignum propionicum DSM 1682]
MKNISIDSSIKERCPEAVLGVLQCKVAVKEDDALFLELLNDKIAELAEIELSQANKREKIQSTRKAYKALGKDANRYRCSAEAMCRRISKERGLYYINNVVDINNYLSIKTGYSMGTYDLEQVQGDILWARAPEGTAYQGIGKNVLNIEFLPALFDEKGPFGNPTSDNTRAMITEKTKEIVMVFYVFDGGEGLLELLKEAETLLQEFAGGYEFKGEIVE